MTDDTPTIESEMERLSCNGQFSVEAHIVNAGQEGAQFFAVEIRQHNWLAFRKPFRMLYGYGSGDTLLEALASAEKVANSVAAPEWVEHHDLH